MHYILDPNKMFYNDILSVSRLVCLALRPVFVARVMRAARRGWHRHPYCTKVDVWSAGVILCGLHPARLVLS